MRRLGSELLLLPTRPGLLWRRRFMPLVLKGRRTDERDMAGDLGHGFVHINSVTEKTVVHGLYLGGYGFH
jgi:hypothetical protein